MTEIPEHLLKRSKERRAALGLPGGEGGDAAPPPASGEGEAAGEVTPAETAPVAARAATPEPAAPPPPPPATAALRPGRPTAARIPYWAMPVLALLPFWAIMYSNSVQVPPGERRPAGRGRRGLLGAAAAATAPPAAAAPAPQLSEGEVLLTFPIPRR